MISVWVLMEKKRPFQLVYELASSTSHKFEHLYV